MPLLEYFKPLNNEYLVSYSGKVVDLKSGKYLKQRSMPKGYRLVTLRPFVGCLVHRLVAQVFVPNPQPQVYNQINHISGDAKSPWADCASNLEWCTNRHNNKEKFALRRRLGLPLHTPRELAAIARRRKARAA